MACLFLPLQLLLLISIVGAQTTVPGRFSSSWIGNTFHGAGKDEWPEAGRYDLGDDWVQNYVDVMTVDADGLCRTGSHWDEGGRTGGAYKDGDVLGNPGGAGSATSAGGFSISGTTVTGNGKTISNLGKPSAIAMGRGSYNGKLIIADNGPRQQILIYDVSGNPNLIETIGADGGIGSNFTINYNLPAATNSPIAYPAGTYAPGVYHPLKLWAMSGVGCDDQGRIFVSTNEQGCAIRCFKKVSGNWILDWKVENYEFCDNAFYDEKTDAVDVYGVSEHFRMNFNNTTPGSEWVLHGYTVDGLKYPQDPRVIDEIKSGGEHGLTGAVMRDINGSRYLWTSGMTSQPPCIFKFKPGTDVAQPCGMFMQRNHRIYDLDLNFWWPPQRPDPNGSPDGTTMIWEDLNDNGYYEANEYSDQTRRYNGGDFFIAKNGDIWQCANPIVVWKATIKANGNLSYSSSNCVEYAINGVSSIGKIKYQDEIDRLVFCTTGGRDLDGGQIYKVNNFLNGGNRDATFVSDLKIPDIRPTHSDITTWTAAGDYGFEVGWSTRNKVWVTDLNTGALAGTMEPSIASGGLKHTGWTDISGGLQVYKRKNGTYLVFIEENGIGAVTMYRWCPSGNCPDVPVAIDRKPAIPQSPDARLIQTRIIGKMLQIASAGSYHLEMYDIKGKLISRLNVKAPTAVDLATGVTAGCRVVKITGPEGTTKTLQEPVL